MTASLSFMPGLLLRTPLWSFADRRPAAEALADNTFRLAVFLASTDFYRALETKGFRYEALSGRERMTLEKYVNRIRFRPTPFGLFSAVSATQWSDEGTIRTDEPGESRLHLLPDHSLSLMAAESSTAGLSEAGYELNPTLYFAAREFRFIKSEPTETTRLRFLLESFEANPLTRKLCKWIARQNRTGKDMLDFLQRQTGCSNEEAAGYLEFLAGAQIMRPAGGPNIIGPDYFLANRPQYPAPAWDKVLPQNKKTDAFSARITGLQQLGQELDRQYPGKPTKNWFYANTVREANGGLPLHYQQQLGGALGALSKLSPIADAPMLKQFIKDFTERFEARKIPLMEALDPETGVGYGPFAGRDSEEGILKTVTFPSPDEYQSAFSWSGTHRLLLSKWRALTPEDPVIRISAGDIATLPPASAPPAPGLSVLFRVTGQGLLIESAGGVSAAALMGRFTPFSKPIHDMAQASARQECAANPGVIFADIGQLSDRHTDNINRRLAIYDYELPVNSCSLLPRDRQVLPSDLLVSVDAGMVLLESARLKKRIIPRLATAYNFRHNHLALFRFLCDLQYQGVQSDLNFDPETWFPGMDHYPRIQYQDTILSPAKWQVKNEAELENAVSLRDRLKLPRHILLTRADQQLCFDLDLPADRETFDRCISGMSTFTIQEALLPDEAAPVVTTKRGAPLTGQFIALAVNTQTAYHAQSFVPPVKARKREFIPGSQWLYYKIYCTPAGADRLLTARIAPVLEKLSRLAKFEWFFVRYADPGHHLRLRVRIPEAQTGHAMALFKKQFSGLVRDRLIREIQTTTYRRELERYGADLMEPVEAFFCASSQLVLEFLGSRAAVYPDRNRFCLGACQAILDHLVPAADQLSFLADRSERFLLEFGGDKALRISLDGLYRKERKALFSEAPDSGINTCLPRNGPDHLAASLRQIAEKARHLQFARRLDLAADLIHMHVNRAYPEQQRRHELVLYYCLYKHHLTLKGMAKQKSNKTDHAGADQPPTAA